MNEDTAKRIAQALERIADVLEEQHTVKRAAQRLKVQRDLAPFTEALMQSMKPE